MKRKLKKELLDHFQSMECTETESSDNRNGDLQNCIDSICKLSKISIDSITVYSNLENPLFFEWETRMIPTMYMLQIVDILPIMTTPKLVIEKLRNGSDLFVGGVISYQAFQKNDLVAIATHDPISIYCVGVATIDSSQMDTMENGSVWSPLHWVDDFLWKLGNEKQLECKRVENTTESDVVEIAPCVVESETKVESKDSQDPIIMDELLCSSFLVTISGLEPPVLASQVFSIQVTSNPTLDLKKSSFKKLQKFIKTMEKRGLIESKEKQGNLYITKVYYTAETPAKVSKQTLKKHENVCKSSILYKVPNVPALQQIISFCDDRHLEYWSPKEIRIMLSEYFIKKDLIDQENKRMVRLDDVLQKLCKNTYMERDKVFEKLETMMIPYYELIMNGKSDIRYNL
jgi:translation initiation factor 2D